MSKYYLTGKTTINLGGIPMEWDGVCGNAYIIAVVDYGETHKISTQDVHLNLNFKDNKHLKHACQDVGLNDSLFHYF